jgi:hypothetical protein
MERIIKESIDNINEPLAIDIIKQASNEITKSKVDFMLLLSN